MIVIFCVCVCVFQVSNQLAECNEILHEQYVIGKLITLLFNFLKSLLVTWQTFEANVTATVFLGSEVIYHNTA